MIKGLTSEHVRISKHMLFAFVYFYFFNVIASQLNIRPSLILVRRMFANARMRGKTAVVLGKEAFQEANRRFLKVKQL